MALLLEKTSKGIACDYWRIRRLDSNTVENKTYIRLSLFVNEQARQENLNNYLEEISFIFDGLDMTREDAYSLLKQPVYKILIDPETEEETQIQVNEFINAVDC